MKKLYQLLLDRWNQKTDTVLVTIVEGNGSVPRTTGAYMVVAKNGRIYGTIGGGNLEYQAVKKAMELAGTAAHYVENFDLGTGENSELGMVCGGRVKVLFYSACAQDPGVGEFLKEALAAADEGKPYWLVLPFSEGTPRIRREITEGRGHCRILEENGQKIYAEEFCYDGRVYIFGGGHLAQELVPVLSHLGFWCMVLDDREEYTDHSLFPGVQETKTVDFTALSQILEVKPEDYLVVVTRGHRCDADVERFALRTPASYIGVVGSKRKTRYVREKLASEGFTEEELDQVQLMTLHASKGLEFPYVYMVGMEEGFLPHQSSIDEDNIDEERRLAYVGITRAQKELTFTLCKERRQYGELVRPEPSRFLLELPQDDLIWEQERKVVSAEERMQKGQSHLANLKAMMAAKRGK